MDAGEGSDGGGSKRERVWCSCTEITPLAVCAAGGSSHTCSDSVMKRCTECKAMCSVCGSINGAFQTPTSRCAARLPRLPTLLSSRGRRRCQRREVRGRKCWRRPRQPWILRFWDVDGCIGFSGRRRSDKMWRMRRCGAVTTRQHRAASVMTSRTAMLRTSGAARIRHSSKLTVKIH